MNPDRTVHSVTDARNDANCVHPARNADRKATVPAIVAGNIRATGAASRAEYVGSGGGEKTRDDHDRVHAVKIRAAPTTDRLLAGVGTVYNDPEVFTSHLGVSPWLGAFGPLGGEHDYPTQLEFEVEAADGQEPSASGLSYSCGKPWPQPQGISSHSTVQKHGLQAFLNDKDDYLPYLLSCGGQEGRYDSPVFVRRCFATRVRLYN